MFEDIFKRKSLITEKLKPYGFTKEDKIYHYHTEILNNDFQLEVIIDDNGKVGTNLIEKENGEPYVLYKTNASGSFVAEVREAIEEVLRDIADKCYEDAIFKTKQAKMLIEFIRKTYGDELEFLWARFSDNAIWRRKDNNKWYGAILAIQGRKIGIDADEIIEIVDLRMNPASKDEILSQENYYPGWHMNKNSWYTIALDRGTPDKELKQRVKESYELAIK